MIGFQKQVVVVFSVIGLMVIVPIDFFHALAWIVIHVYEVVEFILDEAIHHAFKTDRHSTQVIVFYLMMGIFLYGTYRLVKAARRTLSHVCGEKSGYWKKLKIKVSDFFKCFPRDRKAQIILGFTFGSACIAMLVF